MTLVMVATGLVAFLSATMLAVDVGMLMVARTEAAPPTPVLGRRHRARGMTTTTTVRHGSGGSERHRRCHRSRKRR
jgi:hypothetical protein